MNSDINPTKAQEPWIRPRGLIGVIIPSTNIGIEDKFGGHGWLFERF